jgi:hypothetical protein
MLTLPVIILGLVIAMLFGSLYHAIRGGGGWRFSFFCGLSIVGFACGHYLGVWQGWNFFTIGTLNVGTASLGSLLFLIGGEWLSRIEVKNKSSV